MTENNTRGLRGFVFNRLGTNKKLANDVAKLKQKCATDLDNDVRARRVAKNLREECAK